MTASPELLKKLTDQKMNEAKLKNWLASQVRDQGHRLAIREAYGENSKSFYDLKREHYEALHKLNRLEKKN